MSVYPVSEIPPPAPAVCTGAAVFDSDDAVRINQARMAHLDSLGLPLERTRVLDAGCGVGHLARFFVDRVCHVVCFDARPENVAELRARYPDLDAHVLNVETDPLDPLGRFPVVFCYGLLYHLENPLAALRNLARVADDLLLLETLVTDCRAPMLRLVDEPSANVNQTIGSFGCRPSPSWVTMALNRAGFPYIYAPLAPPQHEDFLFTWENTGEHARDGHNLRCLFIASRRPLQTPALELLFESSPGAAAEGSPPAAVTPAARRVWIDVGAHLGEKTFPAAEADPALHVYAFEPNLDLTLQRAGALANYTVLPLAVWEQDGAATFYLNAHDATSSLLPLVPEGVEKWIGGDELKVLRETTVQAVRLDTFMTKARLGKVDYLKIDAQGADLAVVRSAGARLADIQRISLEVQITPCEIYKGASRKDAVLAYMADNGFALESVERQSHDQEENLTFVFSPLLAEAARLAWVRPVGPYPGWRFDVEWDNPDLTFRRRREIWLHFRDTRIDTPFLMRWHDGLKLMLYLSNDQSRQVFVGGTTEPNEFAFLDSVLRPGMVFIDAGANDGLYTLFAARRVGEQGRVWAFEPSAREFERLQRNIGLNSQGQVRAFPLALADFNGKAPLRIADAEHAGQNTLGDFVYHSVGLLRSETVDVTTLDEQAARRELPPINVIKLDVEGAEYRVLRGARGVLESSRPIVMLEYLEAALSGQGATGAVVLDLFLSLGYKLYTYDDASGKPVPAGEGPFSGNIIAAPRERAMNP